ncbi:3'(2'),5'-bisphosphate nucleotidase-like [Musa acuminata AAA Group]|uniref:3'(2'),5'-bisphosphate nucleotidase-like n=1 Tax=Musa acuminata AAA Group TaxID=214697 RepID=UPI0031D3C9B1
MASRAGIRLTHGRSPLLSASASSSRPPPVLCVPLSKPKPYRRHLFVPLCRPLALRSSPGPSSYRTGFSSPVSSMSSSSYEKELAAAKKAASLAARLCQTVQKALLKSDIQSKADKSPVTVADYGSQAIVSLVLKMELPSEKFSLVAEEDSADLQKDESQETLKRITDLVNDTFSSEGTYSISVSEEDVLAAIDSGKSDGGPHGRHWVLDPIDGTKGFVRGDQYAIALALLDEGRVVLGVLACPNLPFTSIANLDGHSSENQIGCLFSAQTGCGAYMQLLHEPSAAKIFVCTTENPADASFFESYEAAHSLHDLSSAIAKKLGVQAPPVRIDSQAKYGALARGDGAIYLRFPHKGYREKIWDHAAGSIVVTEAGGIATDAAGNNLDFSKGRYLDLDTGIIVTNKKLMPSLLTAVQEAIREQTQSASHL